MILMDAVALCKYHFSRTRYQYYIERLRFELNQTWDCFLHKKPIGFVSVTVPYRYGTSEIIRLNLKTKWMKQMLFIYVKAVGGLMHEIIYRFD